MGIKTIKITTEDNNRIRKSLAGVSKEDEAKNAKITINKLINNNTH